MAPVRKGTEYGYGIRVRKRFCLVKYGYELFSRNEVGKKYGYGQFLNSMIRRRYGYGIVFGDLVRVRVRVIVKFDFQLRVRNPYPYTPFGVCSPPDIFVLFGWWMVGGGLCFLYIY